MPRRANGNQGEPATGGKPPSLGGTESRAELIVVARADARLRVLPEGVTSAQAPDVEPLARLLTTEGVSLEPLFGESEDRLQQEATELASSSGGDVPDLSVYYRVVAPEERLQELAKKLQGLDVLEGAYVQPRACAPVAPAVHVEELEERINDMEPSPVEAPPASPNFQSRQGYLGAAPAGIEALWAHTQPGGMGAGIRCIDLEWGWNFGHEDLLQNQGGLIAGANSSSNDHGTAVIGEIGGDRNGFGVLGIAPQTNQRAVSFTTVSTPNAIRTAANALGRGDIMLLEIHRAGPNSGGGTGQFGYIPIEWWPADFDAIRYAVARGVIVVSAAGNGSQNLDAAIYDTPQAGFPPSWSNPFRRNLHDSGSILVGAGAPPPGTHGRNHGPDRSRLGFSNYGSAVDAQGWGREVTSTGYGDLQGGNNSDLWYTDTFSGTSSASPIVVGALACTQGILRARGRTPMSPIRARTLLRQTGSPQTNAPSRPASQRIGNRPNVRQLVTRALANHSRIGVQFRGSLPANSTQRWFTFGWPAQWHVLWSVVPTSPQTGQRQIRYHVEVERASPSRITYWLVVTNLSSAPVQIEGRYAVMGET